MQRLEVSGAVRPIYGSLGIKLLITYLLTSWSRVLLGKLTGSQLVKKFPAFSGTWRFSTAFTSARLSQINPVHSPSYHFVKINKLTMTKGDSLLFIHTVLAFYLQFIRMHNLPAVTCILLYLNCMGLLVWFIKGCKDLQLVLAKIWIVYAPVGIVWSCIHQFPCTLQIRKYFSPDTLSLLCKVRWMTRLPS